MNSPTTPNFRGLSTLLLVWAYIICTSTCSMAMAQNVTVTDICTENTTAIETDEDNSLMDCCAEPGSKCPQGFYDNKDSNMTCNMTDRPKVCSVCSPKCDLSDCCSGPRPEDCFSCANASVFDGLPIWPIVGGTIGGVVFIVLIVVVICVCVRRHSRMSPKDSSRIPVDNELGAFPETEDEDSAPQKTTLSEQISRGHDKVTRYVQDPTENIPQKAPAEIRPKSGMYVNQVSVNFAEQDLKKVSKKKKGKAQRGAKKKDIADEVVYVNTSKERLEIDSLPPAPTPPSVLPSSGPSIQRGPAYITDDQDPSLDPHPEVSPVTTSPVAKSFLSKGPGYRAGDGHDDLPEDPSEVPAQLSAPKDKRVKGNTKKKPEKLVKPSGQSALRKGPAYKASHSVEEDSPVSNAPGEVEPTPGLMKGPAFKSGNRHYENDSVAETAAHQKTNLTQQKAGHAKHSKSALHAKAAASVETDSDSDREDYEEVCPPPVYENFAFQS